jgi:hypothetical protein
VRFPSLLLEAARAGVLPLVVASLVLGAWKHDEEHQPHTHIEPYALIKPAIPFTPAPPDLPPLTWQNNSMEVAAQVSRNSIALRDQQTRKAMTTTMSSPAVLLNAGNDGSKLDWLPVYSIGR